MAIEIRTDEKFINRVHSEERIAGKRASFHIYHKDSKGRARFDISYANEASLAASSMVKLYRELRTNITVMWIVPCNQRVAI